MLKINKPSLAFAIRFSEKDHQDVVGKIGWKALVEKVSREYPMFKAEGITSRKRVEGKKY